MKKYNVCKEVYKSQIASARKTLMEGMSKLSESMQNPMVDFAGTLAWQMKGMISAQVENNEYVAALKLLEKCGIEGKPFREYVQQLEELTESRKENALINGSSLMNSTSIAHNTVELLVCREQLRRYSSIFAETALRSARQILKADTSKFV